MVERYEEIRADGTLVRTCPKFCYVDGTDSDGLTHGDDGVAGSFLPRV